MLAASTPWNIERIWSATIADTTEPFSTPELSRFRGLVMLGTAGSGKTTEAARLATQERASGRSVHECRLAEFSDTSTTLEERLRSLSEGANHRTAFYLDALDEAMQPTRRVWLAIKHWITNHVQDSGASIRITCRSAIWPSELTRVIVDFAGEHASATARLHPLTDDDILAVAAFHEVDAEAFLERIRASGARSLAVQPLSLRMLIRLQQSRHGLPSSQRDLFQKGLALLASDSEDRRDIGTHNPTPPEALLEAAQRLACYMILAGRETVQLSQEPSPNQLSALDLFDKVTETELDGIRLSGLADSTSSRSFRFGHRQFAEYLAGRQLARLPTHQARTLLATSDGWKSGVAGPLRETAAFAAMFNTELADWVATHDPEIIGLSDVADSNLRRAATLRLLSRFRSGEMTDVQLRPGDLVFTGLRYNGADADLRPVIADRTRGCDELQCAIDLARTWELSSLSTELADLVLDSNAPTATRIAAGYALSDCGDPTARRRLKPLIAGLREDEDDELKGIALRCNWPHHLPIPALLKALTAARRPMLYGAYGGFLAELERDGFAAEGNRAVGLRWARSRCSNSGDSDALHRIAMHIAQGALQELDEPVVARELTDLVRHWARQYQSPLAWLPEDPLALPSPAEREQNQPLRVNSDARRKLIDSLAKAVAGRSELLTIQHLTPGLCDERDFLWLLRRGCDRRRKMSARRNYLHLTWPLRWSDRHENVDAWLRVRDREPVGEILGKQRSVDLDSAEATHLRNEWCRFSPGASGMRVATPIDPTPRERVLRVLDLAEEDDVCYFRNLCQELTLEPTSTHYKSGERILTKTPGWSEASEETRARIVKAAQAFLSKECLASEASRWVSRNSHHQDVLGAMWLVLELEPEWLSSRPGSWWGDWCWYVLREIVPNLVGEPEEPKRHLLGLFSENSPRAMCREVMALARGGGDSGFDTLLPDLLPLLLDVPNKALDEELCAAMRAGTVVEHHVRAVSEFVLSRAPQVSIPVCLEDLGERANGVWGTAAEQVALALVRARPAETWDAVRVYLSSERERGCRVLGAIAHRGTSFMDSLSVRQLGELACLLIGLFSPETDPDHQGAYSVTADDSARTLRGQVISYLGGLEDAEAVAALRELEARFGARYPWLRRPRSTAERALRLSRWSPVSVDVVAEVLGAAGRRLIRSEADVMDGIEWALQQYEAALMMDGPESPEDLWDAAKDVVPTPKPEKHVSRKLCGEVRRYFGEYAIAADREVEIRRRAVAQAWGGQPGSLVDVLFQAPARVAVSGEAIRVPIEVKLSYNSDVKTALRAQLADRYLPEVGASHGVYVVVWMNLPKPELLREIHRPKWRSMELARQELAEEAALLSRERGICVRPVVIDGSLR